MSPRTYVDAREQMLHAVAATMIVSTVHGWTNRNTRTCVDDLDRIALDALESQRLIERCGDGIMRLTELGQQLLEAERAKFSRLTDQQLGTWIEHCQYVESTGGHTLGLFYHPGLAREHRQGCLDELHRRALADADVLDAMNTRDDWGPRTPEQRDHRLPPTTCPVCTTARSAR